MVIDDLIERHLYYLRMDIPSVNLRPNVGSELTSVPFHHDFSTRMADVIH